MDFPRVNSKTLTVIIYIHNFPSQINTLSAVIIFYSVKKIAIIMVYAKPGSSSTNQFKILGMLPLPCT
jgi:hypothetical protein